MRYDNYKFKVAKEKQVRVIMDSDAKNEADDQFALVHGLLSPKLNHVGMIATHFGTNRVQDSMEQSYLEMETILNKMNFNKEGFIYRGATNAMPDKKTPVDSEGARFIIKEAMKEDESPLYLAFMGALTDIASAYLIEPRIANRVKLIWIGGGTYPSGGMEFNLGNDIAAANVIFSSPMEVWQVPKNVYEMVPVSFAELECRVEPCGEIGHYLFEQLLDHSKSQSAIKNSFRTGETWVLGDSPSIGLILYEHRFEFDWISAPVITSDMHYIHTNLNRPIRVYKNVDSRLILEDMYCKLKLFSEK